MILEIAEPGGPLDAGSAAAQVTLIVQTFSLCRFSVIKNIGHYVFKGSAAVFSQHLIFALLNRPLYVMK